MKKKTPNNKRFKKVPRLSKYYNESTNVDRLGPDAIIVNFEQIQFINSTSRQFFVSIPPEKVKKSVFLVFSGENRLVEMG